MGFRSGRARHLTSAGSRNKVGVVLWCLARCDASSCLLLNTRAAVHCACGLRRRDRPRAERASIRLLRPAAVQQGKLAPTPLRLSDSSPEPGRVGEPWVSARRTRAHRCWATSLWSRITPIWCRAWPWSSSLAWCLRYSVTGRAVVLSRFMLADANSR